MPKQVIRRRFSVATGAMLVIASMIGTGVFTTTGFLIRDLGSLPAVLIVWLLGGLIALCGALAYAELVAALPHNGGEYQLLTRIYHPALGFIAGWVSLVVGFSAPVAASAVAFGEYFQNLVPAASPTISALLLIFVLGTLHVVRLTWGSAIQSAVTLLDVLLILVFIVAGLFATRDASVFVPEQPPVSAAVVSPGFAISLIYVSFAYSGWNAAVYVAGELKSPGRTLPRSLVWGSTTVVLLYLGLNYVFVTSAPTAALSGAVDIGHVAATHLFGEGAALAVTILVSIGLFTTVSALMMTGPRVYEAMGQDYPRLHRLVRTGRGRGPAAAVVLQSVLAAGMVLTASFDTLLTYMGFTLSLFAALTIFGVFILRRREPELSRPYRMWGYPFSAGAVLIVSAWMLVHSVWQRPAGSGAGLITIFVGYLLYRLVKPKHQTPASP